MTLCVPFVQALATAPQLLTMKTDAVKSRSVPGRQLTQAIGWLVAAELLCWSGCSLVRSAVPESCHDAGMLC